MFAWAVLVAVVVMAMSTVGLVLFGRWKQQNWSVRLIVVITGPVDGALGVFLLHWIGLSTQTSIMGGLLVGIISMLFVQPLVLPQRLLVWRLARENMVRRKRQSALMIAGLVIASAIITSSLVVGDSLDMTVGQEVRAAWGETDVLVSGLDPLTGVSVEVDEDVGHRFWNALVQEQRFSGKVTGHQLGIVSSVSLAAENGLAEPSVALFANNATIDGEAVWAPLNPSTGLRFSDIADANAAGGPQMVVLNSIAAQTLEVEVGDALDLGVFVSRDGERIRTTESVEVFAIVPNEGQGAMAGTRSPAVFVDLSTAQEMLEMESTINRIALAFADDVSDESLRGLVPDLEALMDDVLTATDVGLQWTLDEATSSLTVSSSVGLQRLAGSDVAALRENQSSLYPSASLLEVLQVPLIDATFQGEPLLTLADSEVNGLRTSEHALWHTTANGLGFERFDTKEAWLWQVSEGERLIDVAWGPGNDEAAFLSGNEIILADEELVDETERNIAVLQDVPVAVASGDNEWLVLTQSDEAHALVVLSEDFTTQTSASVSLPTQGTVLSYDLLVYNQSLYLRVEGLLSTTHYVSPLPFTSFVEVDSSSWPNPPATETNMAGQPCDQTASVTLESGDLWCSFEHGLVRLNATNGQVESIRLPVLSDAPGFGKLPQMLLSFGGENVALSVDKGGVLASNRLAVLNLSNGSELAFTGVLPYAYGNDSSVALEHRGSYTSAPGFDQLADLDAVVLGLVALPDAEVLALADENDRSLLMFSGAGFEGEGSSAFMALQAWFDGQSGMEDIHLRLSAVQLDAAEQAEASSGALSAMFLVFGTFTIAAGVLLSLTIIMLLADVRRTELATVRSLGLRRSDARAFFLYEGAVLAFLSSGLGSLVGLALAWMIAIGFSSIFTAVGAQQFTFSWTLDSLLAGWIWGTLLALLLLWSSALYNAQLNIVRALRGARATVKKGVPWGILLLQIMALGMTGICALSLALSGFDNALSYATYVLLGVGLILLLAPLFTWELPVLFNRQLPVNRWVRYAARNTLGTIGVLFLVWTLLLAPVDPLRQRMEPNELAFIVLGLLQVLAGVLVLTSFAPQVVGWLAKQRWVTRRTGPVGSVALAHPLAHPLRTAVVMGMFSITMFSVVVLAGYTEQFDTYSADFVEEAEGEFELLLTSTRARPIDLGDDPDKWEINHSSIGQIDAVGGVYRAPVHLENTDGERMPYLLRGVDAGFTQHGGLPLHVWDSSLGNTSDEAWSSIEHFDNVVFLDASFGLESTVDGTGLVPLQFSIGDSILLIDFSNPKNTRSAVVGGFLKQSSYIFSPGVWMNAEPVESQFSGEMTRMYVSVHPSASATEEYEGPLRPGQGKSTGEREAAAELEAVLDVELATKNINVQTIADEIMVIQSLVLAILSLFEGYLALGLMVGVAGIGVVTVRNVSERRKTIGMLRAIGFRRRHVVRLFSTEVSWVAVLGMLNGLTIGYGFHVVLYKAIWEDEGAAFSFPWASTIMLFLAGWLVVLITTYLPVRRASTIPPSAALRTV